MSAHAHFSKAPQERRTRDGRETGLSLQPCNLSIPESKMPNASETQDETAILGDSTERTATMGEKTVTPALFQLHFPESPWAEQGSQPSRQNQKGAAFQPMEQNAFHFVQLPSRAGGDGEDEQKCQARTCPDDPWWSSYA